MKMSPKFVFFLVLTVFELQKEVQSVVQLLTKGYSLYVQTDQIVELDCEFQMESFNLFDHPVVWRKKQNDEETQINLMGNLQEPFASTRRFQVAFRSNSPVYTFWLKINNLRLEDSGQYICEIHGPLNTCIANITHQLSVEGEIEALHLTNSNRSSERNDSIDVSGRRMKRTLVFVLDRPATLRCSFASQSQCGVRMFLGRKEITSAFDRVQTVEVSGRPGLRQLVYRTQMVSHRFQPELEDNGRRVKCVVYSQSGVINTTNARIIAHYSPRIRCEEKSAYVSERNVFLRCEVTSRPALTSLFWVVNNVTKVSDDEKVDSYWTITMDRTDGVVETSLYMTEVKSDSFRSFVLLAENSVGRETKETTLVQKYHHQHPPPPTQPHSAAPKLNQRAVNPKSFYNETPSTGSGSRSLPMTSSFVVTLSVVRLCRVYVT